ncbi:ppsD [Symbiodinium natans]|uniref:PpsD protein n=1 Tax=Symbiodinium natans TaxID=878477 RepID=A0A812S3T8_9DINO|nr:ppsD [Symbiodinium natans]
MARTSDVEDLPKRFVQNQVSDTGEALAWDKVKKLRVKQSSADNPIHLKQIEIYGCDGINHALQANGGTACQSSMHGPGGAYGPAELVIDGKRTGSVNHTAHADNGWLEVELARPTCVESFAIFNMFDDEWEHRMRLCGHTVELLDESARVVYQQLITFEEDAALFDRDRNCRQLWVNEDAQPVVVNLHIEKCKEAAGQAKVTATQMSGKHLATVSLELGIPFFARTLCYSLQKEAGIPAHSLRLLLPDGRLMRLNGKDDSSLAELLPDIVAEGNEA